MKQGENSYTIIWYSSVIFGIGLLIASLMLRTTGIAIGALIYLLLTSYVFYVHMIASDFALIFVCMLIQLAAAASVYASHIYYKDHTQTVDYIALASVLIIAVMMSIVGYFGQVILS